jgi:hypothetical protein
MEEKIEKQSRPGRKKNLVIQEFNKGLQSLFRAAVSKARLAMMIANLTEKLVGLRKF